MVERGGERRLKMMERECPSTQMHVVAETSTKLTSFSTGASGREKVVSLSNLRDSPVKSNLQFTDRQTDRLIVLHTAPYITLLVNTHVK